MAELTITPDAAKRLAEVREARGEVAFKIDNGCCGGTTLLLIDATFLGGGDIHVGEVADVGVYVERPFADVYSSDRYHIYAREGGRDSGFSVEIPYGFKFLMERSVEGRREG
ncbi:MAG: DUF779 domain-containing protein [Rubrobacteraceae bacterium]